MQKLSDAIRDIIENNALFRMGIHHRLLNLSQLGRYILPQVEARTNKSIQPSAVVMSLSRLQGEMQVQTEDKGLEFVVSNLTIHSELSAITWPNTKDVRQIVNTLHNKILKSGGYLTISEGIHEITIILETKELKTAKTAVTEKPIKIIQHVGSVGITLKPSYIETPGLFYLIFQQMYFQNINIIEIASTANELILYLKEDDVKLAFETIYNRFVKRRYDD